MTNTLDWTDWDFTLNSDTDSHLLRDLKYGVNPLNGNRSNFPKSDNPDYETLDQSPPTAAVDPTLWSVNPFDPIQGPYGSYLEPEGYTAICAMENPRLKSYKRLMPRTFFLALVLWENLPQVSCWGKQISKWKESASWVTITQGKRSANGKWTQKAMSVLDVVKMLAHPDRRALGNKDTDIGLTTQVQQVRIDIDMDLLFASHYEDPEAQATLAQVVRLVKSVYASFGLKCHVFRTGNRGIQAVASIPLMDRREASVLTYMVRGVLKGTRQFPCRAEDFQSSLEGIMRLPLGLHGFTGRLGLFLDDSAAVMPPEQQYKSCLDAFCGDSDDYDTSWAQGLEEALKALAEPHQVVGSDNMPQIIHSHPDNSLVLKFISACQLFDVRGWNENELCTHTNCSIQNNSGTEQSKDETAEEATKSVKTSSWTTPRKLKAIGQAILDQGFEAGDSFRYYVNKINNVQGKNAIGWALVVNDGDVAKAREFLHNQAHTDGVTAETLKARLTLIDWGLRLDKDGLPANNTYERFKKRAKMYQQRHVTGDVLESETRLAQAVVDRLPDLHFAWATERNVRTKTMQAKTLTVTGHILELMLLSARESEDGFARVSCRTLAVEISRRWPDCTVRHTAVNLHLERLTVGSPTCIVDAIVVVGTPSRVTDPTIYAPGPALMAIAKEIGMAETITDEATEN